MSSFDVVVIGGGMMGAPCARHLAEAGHSVALVAAPEPSDRRAAAGPFASHHDAARITRRVAADPDWSLLSRRSIARYAEIEARSGRTIFRKVGAVMAGPAEGPMAGFAEGFRRVAEGLDAPRPRIMGADGARALGLVLPEGSVVCHEAKAAGWIDPRAMREAQVALAARAGARVVSLAAVAWDGGAVTLADGTRVAGGQVVVATGPHAASDGLLPHRPAMRVWARTVAFAVLSEAEGERLAAMPSLIWVPEGWDHDLYLLPPVRYPDGRLRLKVGGQVDSPLLRSADDIRRWYRGDGEPAVGARLMAELRRVLPGLAVEAVETGPCAVAWTQTGFPYVERVDARTTILAGGNGAAAKCGDELGRLGALVATGAGLAGEGYACDFRAAWEGVTATSPLAAAT